MNLQWSICCNNFPLSRIRKGRLKYFIDSLKEFTKKVKVAGWILLEWVTSILGLLQEIL